MTLELVNVEVELEAEDAAVFVETTHAGSESREYLPA